MKTDEFIGRKYRVKFGEYLHGTEWVVISKNQDSDKFCLCCIKGNSEIKKNDLRYFILPDNHLFEEITLQGEQIGGKHYTNLQIQPDEYAHRNGLSFMQGNAIKYITRYKFKNGKEDLLKAISVIQKLIEFEYPESYAADNVDDLIKNVKYSITKNQ